jgi:hypothetical protein
MGRGPGKRQSMNVSPKPLDLEVTSTYAVSGVLALTRAGAPFPSRRVKAPQRRHNIREQMQERDQRRVKHLSIAAQ